MSEAEKTGLVGSVLKFVGHPVKRGRRKENFRWKAFLQGLGWLGLVKSQKALEAAERYAVASVNEREAEVEIKQNRAADIAAETVGKRRANTKATFDLIDDVGVDDEVASQLKLAALLKENPEIREAVDELQSHLEVLRKEKGMVVSFPQIESVEDDGVD
ncbi:MAG: hypothetical protein AAF750_10465 [Planctomycetota bacterium]